AAGRELDVQSVLTGAYQRSEGKIRLTVQLIDVGTGRHLWDGVFDENDRGILKLEDEAGQRIAEAMSIKFNGGAKRAKSHAPAPAVYELYLRGRFAFFQWNETGAKQAADSFEQAVKADPAWAPGYAGLADALSAQVHWGALSPAEAMPRAAA